MLLTWTKMLMWLAIVAGGCIAVMAFTGTGIFIDMEPLRSNNWGRQLGEMMGAGFTYFAIGSLVAVILAWVTRRRWRALMWGCIVQIVFATFTIMGSQLSPGIQPEAVVVIKSASRTSDVWKRIQIRDWFSIELPSNWTVHSKEFRGTVAAWMETKGISGAVAAESFMANLNVPEAKRSIARMNVRFYPSQTTTQLNIRQFSKSDLRDYDASLQFLVAEGIKRIDGKLVKWFGTNASNIDDVRVLICSYQRYLPKPIPDTAHVRLFRVMNGSKSFTLTVAYTLDFELIAKPLTDRIANSIRIQ